MQLCTLVNINSKLLSKIVFSLIHLVVVYSSELWKLIANLPYQTLNELKGARSLIYLWKILLSLSNDVCFAFHCLKWYYSCFKELHVLTAWAHWRRSHPKSSRYLKVSFSLNISHKESKTSSITRFKITTMFAVNRNLAWCFLYGSLVLMEMTLETIALYYTVFLSKICGLMVAHVHKNPKEKNPSKHCSLQLNVHTTCWKLANRSSRILHVDKFLFWSF